MPLNFNVDPYYDDFDPSKNFHRILFKPGRAVQARELTQMQTILQEQLRRFGDVIFKQGTVVTGCAESHNFNTPYVKVLDGFSGNLSDYIGKTITASNGVAAQIKAVAVGAESQTPYLNTLYIQYTSADLSSGLVSQFADGDTLYIEDVAAFTVASDGTGYGSMFELSDGIVYVNGYFIVHSDQIILIARGRILVHDTLERLKERRKGAAEVVVEPGEATLEDVFLAAAGPPPGRMNSLSGASSPLKRSMATSSRPGCESLRKLPPGTDSSPPRSNRSCWTPTSRVRTSSGNDSHSSRPSTAFSSSTSPRAAMRGASLPMREPSPSPVVPASPVRV